MFFTHFTMVSQLCTVFKHCAGYCGGNQGERTPSVLLQDGDGQSVWESVGAPMEGTAE